MKRTLRVAVVSATSLLFGSLFSLAAPAAHADCYGGTTFTAYASGEISGAEDDYWRTESYGATALTLSSSSTTRFHVYGENCELFSACDGTTSCTVTHTGTLSIHVHLGSGPYSITTAPVAVPPTGSVSPDVDCNIVDTTEVCVGIDTGNEVTRVVVREVETYTADTHPVVGAIDQYRFPLPTGGSVVLPCVVLLVDGLGNNDCEVAGGTFVDRTALLVDDGVDQPGVRFGDVITSVGICDARATVTVLGFGAENFPLVSTC